MKIKRLLIFFIVAIVSGTATAQLSAKEKAIEEIKKTENDFSAMASEKGLEAAFAFYADESAIIKRGRDSLIKGREGIRHFYSAAVFKKASLVWSPDFTDAAESGDIGYTFGKYTWKLKSADGKEEESRGIFHSVWKKQRDGSWKFVWD
ncbi:MAG: nuclear transport factor 2 family protein [Ferruginibacter sp.]